MDADKPRFADSDPAAEFRRPRWVVMLAVVAALVALGIALVMVLGPGDHGPGRHGGGMHGRVLTGLSAVS